MKKFLCLLTALMLCLTTVAMAEFVPSRTTGDMMHFEVSAENLPEDSDFFIRPVLEDEETHRLHVEMCQREISKLMASESIVAYFGEVRDAAGNVVSLTEMLGSETLNVFEFYPLIAGEYEAHFGRVTARMLFSTPYEKDEKVAVMIGLVTFQDDQTQSVEWTVYEGVGVVSATDAVELQGCVQVELDADIVLAVQHGDALLAVVSR